MSVREVVRIKALEGKGDECAQALETALGLQAADPTCLKILLERRTEDADEFLLHLVWTTVAAHEAWRAAEGPQFRAHLEGLIDGRPDLLGHYTELAWVKRG